MVLNKGRACGSFCLQGRDERIGLGDGSLHVADQFVHIRLNTDQFVAQPGDRPGVQVVLHYYPKHQAHQGAFAPPLEHR
jgi:hypothetical protein